METLPSEANITVEHSSEGQGAVALEPSDRLLITHEKQSMRAWVFEKPGEMRVVEIERPRIKAADEVLIKVRSAGICFTDKHWFAGYSPMAAGEVLGHEGAGQVVEIGSAVQGLRVGDRIAVNPMLSCGRCTSCLSGSPALCTGHHGIDPKVVGPHTLGCGASRVDGTKYTGLFAEYAVLPSVNCMPIPKQVSDIDAALIEPFTVGPRACRVTGASPCDTVVFFGFEDYAMATFLQLPMSERIVVETIPKRLAMARDFGADATFELDPEVVDHLRARHPLGVDVAFVSVERYIPAARDYFGMATRVVKSGGTVSFVRLHEPSGIEGLGRAYPTFKRELRIVSAGQFFTSERLRGGRMGEFEVLRDQIATGKLSPTQVVTRMVDFNSVEDSAAVTRLFDFLPESDLKIMLTFGTS